MAKAKKKSKTPAKKVAKKATAGKPAVKKTARKAAPKAAAQKTKAAKKPAPTKKPASKPSAKVAKAVPATSAKSSAKSTAVQIDWTNFVTPLDDRMIVEVASEERMTAGGLYIPDSVSDSNGNFKGKVLVAGRGHRDEKGRIRPMDVRTGDLILFAQYSGSKLEMMGNEVLILRESEILGIIEKK